MGASISVTVANLTMEAIEAQALSSFTPAPKVFLRYVDDCFSILQRKNLDPFTAHLNNIQAAIKFTVEVESEGQLPFLDTLVQREGPNLLFKVFRKHTHTGRYLNYNRCTLLRKRGLLSALFFVGQKRVHNSGRPHGGQCTCAEGINGLWIP